jgi:pimeloyl-ACP methyl ester carboxylesterase
MQTVLKFFLLVLTGWAGTAAAQSPSRAEVRPTVVLVHGAFAESASWDAVTGGLLKDGYPVIAVANPLRGVKADSSYLLSLLRSVPGEVILVGHSYAGIVMTEAAGDAPNVKSLVYVAGYAPDVGESAASISRQFPEGTLGPAIAPPVTNADGSKDLYIDQSKFWSQFAADVPQSDALKMAASQRPIAEAALAESVTTAAWKTKPSWFIYGSRDKNIPRSALAFMAKRAAAKETVEVPGASHVVMISHPQKVLAMIKRAAASR